MKRNHQEDEHKESSSQQHTHSSSTEIVIDMDHTFVDRCKHLLAHSDVSVLPAPPQLIIFQDTDSLAHCFKKLIEHNILSAPIWNTNTKTYTGFLDVRDLVHIIVHLYDAQKAEIMEHPNAVGVGKGGEMSLDEFVNSAVLHEKLLHLGTNAVELSQHHTFVPIKKTDKLSNVLHLMTTSSLHRVPVLDDDGQLVNIISQSTILKYLGNHCIHIPERDHLDVSIQETGLGSHPVLSVSKTESVINTFRKLDENKHSGLALVDDEGRLVGTTTGKDLGLFLKNPNFGFLDIPIFQHLQKIRAEQFNVNTPCISVFATDKLSRAVGLLVATKVHRLFVVDDEVHYRPTKVISIQDILKFLDK